MASLLPFYKLAREAGITPIMGAEFYYIDEPTIHDVEHRKASHLILLAKNYDGFQNMLRLSKLSYTEGYYYKPRIGLEWLKKYHEGIVCLSACQGGVLSNEIWRDIYDQPHMGLVPRFKQFREIFGNDFYVEFQGHYTGTDERESGKLYNSQELINRGLFELHKQKGFQPILTNDCHYILKEHSQIQKVIKDISYGKADSAESSTVTQDHGCDSLWLKDARQVYEAFREHHEYLPKSLLKTGFENVNDVFEKCRGFELPKDKRYLPRYRAGVDSTQMFKSLVFKQFKAFVADKSKHRAPLAAYKDRLQKEMRVILKYGLEDYFLIVWDLVAYAAKRDIYTGLGRGSAAGCLVSYILDIVKIDPLEHGLLFERFLNENRCESGELPDIDLDFESNHREDIKKYIYETYGAEHVCEIGTYGRMMLKTALIDFAKATGAATHSEILAITTKLDLEKEDVHDLDAAMEFDGRLKALIDKHPKLGFMVREIEGQIKTQGMHPAGLIICSEPVAEVTPVKSLKDNKDKKSKVRIVATQSEDKHVIAQGLMKVDVLGLKEYDVIKYVIEHAQLKKTKLPTLTRANYVDVIMNAERECPNEKVWDMFQRGKTEGVFQFASDGMKELLVAMKPTEINDLIAANALYRPGVLENGWHMDYCNRKNGHESVKYIHEDVKKALGETYGIIVYQEQFMEVIHRLGGVSLVDSDTIRSALGKKDKDKLNKFRAQFVKGASKRISKEKANELWDQIEKASGYTFNKSHSAAYSVLAYISQYLKVNYPAHFWAAQLHWDVQKGKVEDMLTDRRAAQEMGVLYRMPDINKSRLDFTVHKGEIVWSISAVKGVGPKAAEAIIAGRPYEDFEDFYNRVNKSVVKYNVIEAMIYSGVFDSMADRRDCLRQLSEFRSKKTRPMASGKWAGAYVKPTEEQLMMKFKDAMGFFERKIKDLKGNFSKDVITESELRELYDGDTCKVGGVITDVRVIKTKNKEPMAFVTLMDLDEMIDVTIFPRDFPTFKPMLHENKCIEIVGKKNVYKERQKGIIANSLVER